MYHVSAQGVDERMINIHLILLLHWYVLLLNSAVLYVLQHFMNSSKFKLNPDGLIIIQIIKQY